MARGVTPRPKRQTPERALHIAVEQFLRLAWPPRLPYSHFPAGEHRDKATAAKLKAFGLRPGWPDFIFILPNGQAGFIELKAGKGALSDAQIEVRAKLVALKCGYATARSVDEVERTLAGWLALFGERLRATTGARPRCPAKAQPLEPQAAP